MEISENIVGKNCEEKLRVKIVEIREDREGKMRDCNLS